MRSPSSHHHQLSLGEIASKHPSASKWLNLHQSERYVEDVGCGVNLSSLPYEQLLTLGAIAPYLRHP